MELRVINECTALALEEMKQIVEDLVKSGGSFTKMAAMLTTLSPFGDELEVPCVVVLRPECIQPALTADQFDKLLVQVADEGAAVAAVVATSHPTAPVITLEKRGSVRMYEVMNLMTEQWQWHESRSDCKTRVLPSNRSN